MNCAFIIQPFLFPQHSQIWKVIPPPNRQTGWLSNACNPASLSHLSHNIRTVRKLVSILSILIVLKANGQIISRFTWSSTPLTKAAQGPNGTSISASATNANVGGSIGWALNPGLPTANIDLVVPGSPYFDVNSIDISLYFRREESVASFWKRGANFDFGSSGGYLTVKFTTTRGSTPGDTTINSGNIVAIANDHAFHNYRFRYDNNTGVATVLVDGTIVYTYNGVAGRPLSWTGAGNVIIGENMDATSTNIPVLANMTVQLYNLSLLPLHVLSFDAVEKKNKCEISWKVSDETDVVRYAVERSADNVHFTEIASANAANTDKYSATDNNPLNGMNYYRLRVIDKHANSTYSNIRQLRYESNVARVSCYPNPAVSSVTINIPGADEVMYEYSFVNLQGVTVQSGAIASHQAQVKLERTMLPGTYILRLRNRSTNDQQSVVLMKGN